MSYGGAGTAFTGGAITTPITGANGGAAAPTYSFSGATSTGLYNNGGAAALASAGVTGFDVTSNQAFTPYLGSAGFPALGVNATGTSGLWVPATGVLGLSAAGA
jgi:hypothetical protein